MSVFMHPHIGLGRHEQHTDQPHPTHSCLYLIIAFSLLIDASEALTDIGGLAARLAELLVALEETSHDDDRGTTAGAVYDPPPVVVATSTGGNSSSSSSSSSGGGSEGRPLLTIEGLSLRLPDGRWLVKGFGLTVRC